MRFSIITPSFRSSEWLKLCIASVNDQQGVDVEHIVQDSCSDDGTLDWLPQDHRVKSFIEKDTGMYDAINRGYKRATGDILAYLNCDEQYLPGGLKIIHDFFEKNPEVEVVLAGTIVTNGEGEYICHRQPLIPNNRHIWFRFNALTSSIFLRRSVIYERGLYFDTKWSNIGDFHWVRELMKKKVRMAVCRYFTSVFADTGENLNLKPSGALEAAETLKMVPAWVKKLKPLWVFNHRIRRLLSGHFNLKPMSYSIYTKTSPARRVSFDVHKPSAIWKNRM